MELATIGLFAWVIPVASLIVTWILAVRFIRAVERIAGAAEVLARTSQSPRS